MRVLVTGSSGFLASHVLTALARANRHIEITGLQRSADIATATRDVVYADITSASDVEALAAREFDVCVHLAGTASGNSSLLYRTNVTGTGVLLTALGRSRRVPHVVLISSSAVYGRAAPDGDVHENMPLAPASPYGESCVAREMAARLVTRDHGMELTTLRLFNLVGPGQKPGMMIPAVARQIVRIEKGLQQPTVVVGRLDTARDYVDVRDAAVAVAAVALGAGPHPWVLNIGSGQSWMSSDVVAALLKLGGITPTLEIRQDAERATDVRRIRNASTLARTRIPWKPIYTMGESLRDVLDDWRTRPRHTIA